MCLQRKLHFCIYSMSDWRIECALSVFLLAKFPVFFAKCLCREASSSHSTVSVSTMLSFHSPVPCALVVFLRCAFLFSPVNNFVLPALTQTALTFTRTTDAYFFSQAAVACSQLSVDVLLQIFSPSALLLSIFCCNVALCTNHCEPPVSAPNRPEPHTCSKPCAVRRYPTHPPSSCTSTRCTSS